MVFGMISSVLGSEPTESTAEAAETKRDVDAALSRVEQANQEMEAAQKRLKAAEMANWDGGAPAGRHRGVAVHRSFNTYVAEIAEVSRRDDGTFKVEKVWCAVDCGVPINPDNIKAQMEGGIGYGVGHAMRDAITLRGGAVEQSNFPDYEPLRISDIHAIDVHIVPSAEAPSGVGEPGTPPAGPALANAIAAAGGPRVTILPMVGQVEFA